MRIIAGKYRSRRLETLPGTSTRPTLDKVKEALFSSLGGMFDGGNVLDLYSGSGAIGLEAISRGFDNAVLVDQNRAAIQVIKKNVEALQCNDQVTILPMKDVKALSYLESQSAKFDLVYLDPPYAKQKNIEIIQQLIQKQLLLSNATIVIESLKEDVYDEPIENVEVIKSVVYGIMKITYLRYKGM